MTSTKKNEPASAPWWRYGHMWLVVGGPALVVVGCVVLAFVAARGADPVVDADYYRRGIEINKQLRGERAQLPAQQARNHAATPAREQR